MIEKRKRGRPVGTKLNGRTRYLSEQELQAFFKIANQSKRNGFLFSTILFFGLRSAEAAQLRLDNFNLRDLKVTIEGKKHGLTREYLEAPDEIWHKLRQYLKVREAHEQNPYLFPSRHMVRGHMSPIGIQFLFKRICRKAGVVGHSVHDMRHSCGRRLALMNLSPYRISRHLRQKDSASSNRYVDLKDDREADTKIREEMWVF